MSDKTLTKDQFLRSMDIFYDSFGLCNIKFGDYMKQLIKIINSVILCEHANQYYAIYKGAASVKFKIRGGLSSVEFIVLYIHTGIRYRKTKLQDDAWFNDFLTIVNGTTGYHGEICQDDDRDSLILTITNESKYNESIQLPHWQSMLIDVKLNISRVGGFLDFMYLSFSNFMKYTLESNFIDNKYPIHCITNLSFDTLFLYLDKYIEEHNAKDDKLFRLELDSTKSNIVKIYLPTIPSPAQLD
jgi:hypothetical protein